MRAIFWSQFILFFKVTVSNFCQNQAPNIPNSSHSKGMKTSILREKKC